MICDPVKISAGGQVMTVKIEIVLSRRKAALLLVNQGSQDIVNLKFNAIVKRRKETNCRPV